MTAILTFQADYVDSTLTLYCTTFNRTLKHLPQLSVITYFKTDGDILLFIFGLEQLQTRGGNDTVIGSSITTA